MFDVLYQLVGVATAGCLFYLALDWLFPKQPPKWWGKDDDDNAD